MVVLTEQIVKGKTRIDKLEEVKNLNLWGQDINDVAVLAKMAGVEVLSLSVNRIQSLRDFRHCKRLQELYLRKNFIQDISDLQYLVPLTELKVLWLCDNPISDHPLYRQLVALMLPSVDKLDNTEISPQERDVARRNPELLRVANSLGTDDSHANNGSPLGTPLSGKSQYAPAISASTPPSRASKTPEVMQRSPSADAGRRRKNVLYAVMALVAELEEEDLLFVKREIEQRLGSLR